MGSVAATDLSSDVQNASVGRVGRTPAAAYASSSPMTVTLAAGGWTVRSASVNALAVHSMASKVVEPGGRERMETLEVEPLDGVKAGVAGAQDDPNLW